VPGLARTPAGAGDGLWEHTNFNSRRQATEIGLGTASADSSTLRLAYDYGTTNNNGNLRSQTITVNGSTSFTQSYTYDPLNRLATASEGSNWSQTFSYDRYGNRALTASSGVTVSNLTPQSLASFAPNSNRISSTPAGSFTYDTSGNLTQITDHALTNLTYGYDAENRMVSSNQGGASYSYDGEGRRVKSVANGVTTVFVHDSLGKLMAEYVSDPRLNPPSVIGGLKYVIGDHLGSTRVVVSGGTGAVKVRYDYLPFGEIIDQSFGGRNAIPGYSGSDSLRQKFVKRTGQ